MELGRSITGRRSASAAAMHGRTFGRKRDGSIPATTRRIGLKRPVCRAVCDEGSMTPVQGQVIFLGDWIAGAQQISRLLRGTGQ